MSSTSSSLGRSLLLLRHRCDQQVHSMDGHDSSSGPVHLFDRHVSSFLLSLLPPSGDQIPDSFLSLSWINNLLRSFPPLLDEFHSLLSSKLPNCPSLDRSIADFHDRSVKALDLLNAVRDGLDRVRHVGSHLGAAVSAINSGRALRAGKLLADLSSLIGGDAHPAAPPSHRNRSFNRDQHRHRQLRTLSWSVSVSRAWSASRQLQAMGSSLAPPRAADVSATNGLAVPIFAMSSVLLFVLWVLVAAVPCQDRGSPHAHVPPPPPPPPRGYAWAAVMASVQEKVLEEAKRRERKGHSGGGGGGGGLMTEMCRVESASRNLTEMMGKERSEGREREVRELEEASEGIKEGLESAERQVRDLFCRIVRYRTQGLDRSPTRT